MLRVLIVDDEYEIREGLRRRIPWEACGIGDVVVADDGDTALRVALEEKPDLIVTDIKMNRMNGLEFLGALQSEAEYPWKAILISGYDDFELVKQAMQLGAIDYVLKPINADELRGIVFRAVESINRERMDKLHQSQMKHDVQFAVPKLREELLREIAEHAYDPYRETRISHRLQTLQLDWISRQPLLVMAVEVDDLRAIPCRRGSLSEKELVLFGIGNVVTQTLSEEFPGPSAAFGDSDQRWVALLGIERPELVKTAEAIGRECLRRVNDYVKVKASIGMGLLPKDFIQLHELYRESVELLDQKAVFGGNRLFTEAGRDPHGEPAELSIREPGEVVDLVKYGSDDDIRAAMNQFDEMVQAWSHGQLRDIQQHIFQWLIGVFRGAAASGWPDRQWERNPIAVWEQLEQFDTLASLKEQVESHLLSIAADFRQLTLLPSQIVLEAEKIIRSRYADNLSLQSVADEVHVTPVWLSKLFKKEKRRTFLEVLTEVRIMKAKEMLGDVKHKIYQISYQVGYKDPVHFTKLFKKHAGCTPKEYRKLRGIADD